MFLLVCVLETISGGFPALEALLTGPFPVSLLLLLGVISLLIGLDLLLQGPDVLDCAVDQKGIHIECCLPRPASWKLLSRMRPVDSPAGEDGMVVISVTEISWSSITRVQLWPGQDKILFYCHSPWLSAALPCTPFSYGAVAKMITEKLGKKKQVRLPAPLRRSQKGAMYQIHMRSTLLPVMWICTDCRSQRRSVWMRCTCIFQNTAIMLS